MALFSDSKLCVPTAAETLPGRDQPMPVPETHFVAGTRHDRSRTRRREGRRASTWKGAPVRSLVRGGKPGDCPHRHGVLGTEASLRMVRGRIAAPARRSDEP
jgi:hypothetical protein